MADLEVAPVNKVVLLFLALLAVAAVEFLILYGPDLGSGSSESDPRSGSPEPAEPSPRVQVPEVSKADPLPPAGSSIVVVVSPVEGVTVDGAPVSLLSDWAPLLARRAARPEAREADGSSRMDVVLYVDEDTPFVAVQWALMSCADPRVKAWRVHFAAKHRASGERGVVPAFLPKDRGISPTPTVVSFTPDSSVVLLARDSGEPTSFEAIHGALVRARALAPASDRVAVDVPSPHNERVRFGAVLRVIDGARQAGFARIELQGTALPKGMDGTPLRDRIARLAARPRAVLVAKVNGVFPAASVGRPVPDGPAPSRAASERAAPRIAEAVVEEEMIEEELPPQPEETEQVHEADVAEKEPTIKDAELSDHDESDSDLPLSDAPFEGPANNGLIGIGGGAGGAFKGRGGHRNLRAGGGGSKSDDAVENALLWLKAHQSPDGQWECEGFPRWCERQPASGSGPDGTGKAQYDVGVTGLALLAFLGAGYTNRSDGPFGNVVGDGLRYLKNVQDAEGCFGNRASGHFIYNHAIATLAMVEAYGMTGSANYKRPAQKALDFIALARNPYFAWRYGVKPGDNDTSVTGWMTMALQSARLVNAADRKAGKPPSLTIDEDSFEGIKAWIGKMTDPDFGRVGYQIAGSGPARPTELVDRFPQEKSEAMTAVAILSRILLGEDPKTSDPIRKGTRLCEKLLPAWNPTDGSVDMYYWYYATLALFQVGGDAWNKWDKAMKPAVIDTQRLDTDSCAYKGSWDPIDPWGQDGGRVYSTAILALCLEVRYRYERVFGASPVTAPTAPAAKPYPDVSAALLERGRALAARFEGEAAKGSRLLDEALAARKTGDDTAWADKMKAARALFQSIADEWNDFEASLPSSKDYDQDEVAAHYFARERGLVQRYAARLAALKKDAR